MKRWIVTILAAAVLLNAQRAAADTQARSVTLEWTAPGDDGWIGRAQSYDIRYSRQPITSSTWAQATALNTSVLPGTSGTKERLTVLNLASGVPYYFALKSKDDLGNWSSISNVAYIEADVVGVDGAVATEPQFSSPRPNPVGRQATFSVTLPRADRLRVEAFDLAGRKVRTIAQGEYSGGTFDVRWNLHDDSGHLIEAGTYVVRGQLGENVFLRRVTVIR